MKLRYILEQFKLRNVRRTLTIYFSTALTSIGVIKLLQEVYDIPASLFPIAVTVLLCGLGNAFIFAWYHGMDGSQGPLRKRELLLHALFLGLAAVLSFRAVQSPRRPILSADAKSIAVLPFKNLSESKDEYFSDGITEDILTQLSKIGDLRVISRTTAMKYKDTKKSISEIGDELGVGTVLEGSVRRDKNRVRIDSKLIDAKTDEQVWAETYDREMRNVFDIQSDVARQIAAALKATLSPEEITLIEHKPTSNLDAYGFYLQGRKHYYRYQEQENQKAIEFFKRALLLDSAYAEAHAGLSDAYCQSVQKYLVTPDWLDSTITEARIALELNPSLAEAHKALGQAQEGKGWQQEALDEYMVAVRLDPNHVTAIANLGALHESLGNLDEALRWLRKAVTLAPDHFFTYISIAGVYQLFTMDSLAIEWYEKAQKIDPDQLIAKMQLGWLHLLRGDFEQAKRLRDTVLARDPGWQFGFDYAGGVETFLGNYRQAQAYYDTLVSLGMFEARYQLAYVLLKQGKKEQAGTLLRQTLELYLQEIEKGATGYTTLEASIVYSLLGNHAEANRLLKSAIEKGLQDYRWLMVDPRMENLRADPEALETIMSLKRSVERMRA